MNKSVKYDVNGHKVSKDGKHLIYDEKCYACTGKLPNVGLRTPDTVPAVDKMFDSMLDRLGIIKKLEATNKRYREALEKIRDYNVSDETIDVGMMIHIAGQAIASTALKEDK